MIWKNPGGGSMKKLLFLSVASVLILFLPVMSWAEIREGSFEINPFGGYSFGSQEPEDRPAYGLRAGYNLTRNWGVEAGYTAVDSKADIITGDVLYHFNSEKAFNPFVLAGIGGANVRPSHNDNYETVVGDIGIGFKYFFNDTIAFRTDVRDVVNKINTVFVTAGISFALGGKRAVAAPPPPPAPEPPPPPPPPAQPKPAPEPTPPPPPPPPAPVRVILEDIHFEFDKATLTDVARNILDENIQTIKENPGIEVQIEGHACAHGPEDYNMALSERRANAVKEYLIQKGISPDRLTTISYGETRLAMPEIPTPYNKQSKEAKANRRVHFEVIVK
jgi:OOP family OmpA-OmpF porin